MQDAIQIMNTRQVSFLDILENDKLRTQLYQMCKTYASSVIVPDRLKNKPDDCYLIAIKGLQLGLDMFTSCQYICVINGQPSVYGDGGLAIGMRHPNYLKYEYTEEGDVESKNFKCTVIITKKDGSSQKEIFTYAQYVREGLNTKDVWKKHTEKMFWRRTIRNAFTKCFPECYSGVIYYEQESLNDIEKNNNTSKIQPVNMDGVVEVEIESNIPDNADEIMKANQEILDAKRRDEMAGANQQTLTI